MSKVALGPRTGERVEFKCFLRFMFPKRFKRHEFNGNAIKNIFVNDFY